MDNDFLKQLWLAVKIWLVAVLVNGVLGALVLCDFEGSSDMGNALPVMIVVGAIFSIPSLVTILVIIWVLADFALGTKLFWAVMVGGLVPAVLVFAGLMHELGDGDRREMQYLLGVVIISGVAGVTTFYRSLLRWGSDQDKVQNYSHENLKDTA